jgi:hypothetical protein
VEKAQSPPKSDLTAHVGGRAPAALRNQALRDRRVVLLLDASGHVGGHDAGPELVDGYAEGCEASGPELYGHGQGCLGEAVIAARDRSGLGGDAGDEDDLLSRGVAWLQHSPGHGLGEEIGTLDIAGHDLMEGLDACVQDILADPGSYAGVVHQGIEAARQLPGRIDQHRAILGLGNIRLYGGEALAGARRQPRAGFDAVLGRRVVRAVIDRHRPAGASQGLGYASPYAASPSRHQCRHHSLRPL